MDSFLKNILDVSRSEKFAFDTSETWLDLFKRQVDKNLNHIAVADDKSSMTYAELDAKSDRIAVWLLEKGVQENEFVAIRMSRTKEFVAAMLGVQKIGAAYVPIDLDYPAGRVAYMINDCEARITLTDELIAKILSSDIQLQKILKTTPENFAYMIYTSGSTGKPKGVVIQHRALLNFIYFISHRWGLTEQSRIACHSNFAFDASVEDLLPPLTVGGTVFIVPEDIRRDVFEMRNFISRHKINGGSYSTRFGQLLTDENHPLDLNYITVGGEAMTSVPNVRGKVFNTYGPTEFTVDATYFELEEGKTYNRILTFKYKSIIIGINIRLFLLHGRICCAYGGSLQETRRLTSSLASRSAFGVRAVFILSGVVDEVRATSDIEGIHSTRKEIKEVVSGSIQSARFSSIVAKYKSILTDSGQISFKTCEDIRAFYDEFIHKEVT